MKNLFTIPTWQVFLLMVVPLFVPTDEHAGFWLQIAWMFFIAATVFVLVSELYRKLPEWHDLNLKKFKFAFFFPLIYFICVFIYFGGGYNINQDNYKDYGDVIYVIIPLHILAMICFFYVIRFLAKSIATVEQNRIVDFSLYAGYFFLILFYPIGIWWVHLKVRKIFKGELPVTEDPDDRKNI